MMTMSTMTPSTTLKTENLVSDNHNHNHHLHTIALESAIDAHATRILKSKSPPESCIDSSLGPYVTSVLRCSITGTGGGGGVSSSGSGDAMEEVPEYEALVELLEEHCGMDSEVAREVLGNIGKCVKTGVIENSDIILGSSIGGGGSVMGSGSSAMTTVVVGAERRSLSSSGSSSSVESNGSRLGHLIGSESIVIDRDSVSILGQMLGGSSIIDSTAKSNSNVELGRNVNIVSPGSIALDGHSSSSSSASSPVFHGNPLQTNGSNMNCLLGTSFSEEPETETSTPLKPDKLIPGDLFGVDSPNPPPEEKPVPAVTDTTTMSSNSSNQRPASQAEDHRSHQKKKPKPKTGGGKSKKMSKKEAKELAASLFQPSRPVANSTQNDNKSPKLRALSGPPSSVEISSSSVSSSTVSTSTLHRKGDISDTTTANEAITNTNNASSSSTEDALQTKLLDSTKQILLSMNNNLGEEAALEASLISNADVNVAQYIIDGAMSAKPVCRHALNDGCYRSDCQFSHDVEGHTCLFWLRGRCGKGPDRCRFLHGFCEDLLSGIKADFLPEHHKKVASSSHSSVGAVEATNSVQLNAQNPFQETCYPTGDQNVLHYSTPVSYDNLSQKPLPQPLSSQPYGAPQHIGQFQPSSPFAFSLPHHAATLAPVSLQDPANNYQHHSLSGTFQLQPDSNTTSFAKIASKAAKQTESSWPTTTSSSVPTFSSDNLPINTTTNSLTSPPSNNNNKTIKIPKDIWNPSFKRDSSLFNIPDPIERYNQVCLSNNSSRDDVIDLHFQSVKTFSTVLAHVLPSKLSLLDQQQQGIWIVTGTGHHVNKSSHQKGGGVLENAVVVWLEENGYEFFKGRDRMGHGGAILVVKQ